MNSDNYWLLVEDDDMDVLLFNLVWGLTQQDKPLLKVCTNGEDAINFLKTAEKFPKLIISDINMPKMSGYELLLEIQNDKILSQNNIPFVVLTTSQDSDDKEKFSSKGIHNYFIKPFYNTGWDEIINKMFGLIDNGTSKKYA